MADADETIITCRLMLRPAGIGTITMTRNPIDLDRVEIMMRERRITICRDVRASVSTPQHPKAVSSRALMRRDGMVDVRFRALSPRIPTQRPRAPTCTEAYSHDTRALRARV